MKRLLTALLILSSVTIYAQKATVYETLEDYNNNKVHEEALVLKLKVAAKELNDEVYEVTSSEGRDYPRYIDDRSYIVKVNGRTLINNHIIKRQGFTRIVYENKDYILFRGGYSKLSQHLYAMSHLTTVHRGYHADRSSTRLLKGKKYRKKRYNYIVNRQTGRVYVANDLCMQEVLDPYPQLYKEYMSNDYDGEYDTILYYLKKIE